MRVKILLSIILFWLNVNAVFAQTTAFTYQGKLSENGNPANGSYEFEFKLFDALTGGTQIGTTVTREEVMVTNGIFTVELDFGAAPLNGANRFLEISVRPSDGPGGATLTPRQQITTAPYAIRSLNAASADGLSVACANCVTSSQIGSVNGSAVTGQIPVASVPAGSGNYVQNTTSQQAASNFNISGNGTAGGTLTGNIVNATTQFNIGVNHALSLGTVAGVFAGRLAGASNTTGSGNSFFGDSAGRFNTTAGNNSFFGRDAGTVNTASDNSFFGAFAGDSNTTGTRNSFFGRTAGDANQTGTDNSFFGYNAGRFTTASFNSFFGSGAGDSTTSGSNNVFVGYNAGQSNTTGGSNAFFGYNAGTLNTASLNSFFGANAGDSNTTGTRNSFFGRSAGSTVTNATDNSFFGNNAGLVNTASDNSFFGASAGDSNTTGTRNSFFGRSAGGANATGTDNSFFGYHAGLVTTGPGNSFFGSEAGSANTGIANSFFGSNAGRGTTSGNGNAFVGINTGSSNTTGDDNTIVGGFAGENNTTGSENTIIGAFADVGSVNLHNATAIGAGSIVFASNTVALGTSLDTVRVYGNLVIETLGAATATPLCINSSDVVSACSSSIRYKGNVISLKSGLNIVKRLRPVTFEWKGTNQKDLGLIAEEVEAIDPLLVTRDKQGEIQGVKYVQLSVVLINAMKEQQAQIVEQQRTITQQQQQIDQQQKQLRLQQQELEALKQLVCSSHPQTEVCKCARLRPAASKKPSGGKNES